jgi:hypothetical protein
MRKLTNEEYIKKANIKHNYKYSYDKLLYISSTKKVKIICNIHGEFEQEANSHLRGVGCPSCSGNIKSDNLDFIKKSKLIHGDKYDYSKVNYINSHTKIIIICKEHGEFEQVAHGHLLYGCNKCGIIETTNKNKKDKDNFISEAIKIHGDKYDYSKVNYVTNKKNVIIVCKEHGYFIQSPQSHLRGSDCKICSNIKRNNKIRKTNNEFIEDAIKVHGFKYDYSLVNYTGTDNKIDIICKSHGLFRQKCSKHLQNQGCPICKESKLEKEIRLFLTENNINYKQQYGKSTDDVYLNRQRLDFYLIDYKIAIECQGQQHFTPVDFGNKGLNYSIKQHEKIKQYDLKKYNMCKEMGIEVIYYSKKNNIVNYIGEIFSDLKELSKKLKI